MFGKNKQVKPKITLYERLMGQKEPDIDSVDLSGIDTNNPYFAENVGIDEPQVKMATSQNPRVGGILPDIFAGYKENRTTPFSLNNLGNNQIDYNRNKGFAYRLGEGLGSLARIGESPLGRGLITGAAVAALGGTPAETLAYGASAGALNQANRSRDSVYRQQMLQSLQDSLKNSAEWEKMTEEQKEQALQNAEKYVSGIRGYISNDTYKNFVQAQQLRDNAEWRKKYFESQQEQNNIMNQLRRDQLERQEHQDTIQNQINFGRLDIEQQKTNAYIQNLINKQNKTKEDKATLRQINDNAATLADIDAGLQLIEKTPSAYGPVKGHLPASVLNIVDKKGISTRTQIDNITAVYRKWLTGAQMSDAERKAYERFLPAPTDTREAVKAKLQGMKNSIERRNQVLMQGVMSQQINSENDDPLGIL